MFAAVLRLHDYIAPKISTITREDSPRLRDFAFISFDTRDFPQSGYLRRANFYCALVRLSYSQIHLDPCLYIRRFYVYFVIARRTILSSWFETFERRALAITCHEPIRYNARAFSLLKISQRSVVFAIRELGFVRMKSGIEDSSRFYSATYTNFYFLSFITRCPEGTSRRNYRTIDTRH